jgi:hypothetical protein
VPKLCTHEMYHVCKILKIIEVKKVEIPSTASLVASVISDVKIYLLFSEEGVSGIALLCFVNNLYFSL